MKHTTTGRRLGMAMLLVGLLVLPACKTDDEGTRSSYRSQWTNLTVDTQAATDAAEAVLQDLNLRDIDSSATAVDGQVIGYTADGTRVTVSVERVTDSSSQVSVNVGTLGDPDLGGQIIRQIRERIAD